MARVFDWVLFRECPIVGILRGFEPETLRGMVAGAIRGGLVNIEVTMNSPGAEESIRLAADEAGEGVNVGAGTVCTTEDLDRALDAGASFIVTPVLVPEVVRSCKERKVPIMPGALTPTEIYMAWQLGADLVKVFPANHFGPKYLKDLKGPLPEIRLMPTGGIDATTIADYHAAGAEAFGVGGALFTSALAESKDWDAVERDARRLVDAYRSVC